MIKIRVRKNAGFLRATFFIGREDGTMVNVGCLTLRHDEWKELNEAMEYGTAVPSGAARMKIEQGEGVEP